MNVTPDDLLRGMWYALQSCGEKLGAARELCEHEDYGPSVALTMAARDEFAKARMLRALWRDAAAGTAVTLDQVQAICGKRPKGVPVVTHLDKQRAAQVSVTLRTGPGHPLRSALERNTQAIQTVAILRQQGVPVDDPRMMGALLNGTPRRPRCSISTRRQQSERQPNESRCVSKVFTST